MCYTHKDLKEAFSRGLVLQNGHRVIKFNQKACLKPYVNTNTELSKKAKK